jgi:PAS domain S-box-containing protein
MAEKPTYEELKRQVQKLQKSEIYYRTLLQSVNDAILVHEIGYDGMPGKFIDANHAAIKRLGYSHDELLRLTPKDITTEKGYKDLSEARASIVSKNTAIFETTHFARNGCQIPVESHVNIVEVADRRVAVSVVRDLSERKMAEKVLKERVKELTFLHSITRIVHEEDNFGRICQKIAHAMPKAWCYPKIACARIICEGQSYQTDNFSKTEWCLSADIKVKNKSVGSVEVCYLEESPARDEGPFIQEERNLINICAERLGHVIERMRAEEQLQKSEEQFRDLYDNAPVGYFEYDLRGNITRVNHTYLGMLGYIAEEVIGQPCWKFIVDEVAREQIMAKLDGVRPPAIGLERTYRRKDGTTFPVLFQDRLLLNEEGHIKGIRTTIQDITARKDAEESLKEREESLQAILDNSPTLISEYDLEGRYIRVNHAVTKLLKRNASDLVGKTFNEILPADTVELFMKRIEIVSNTCEPITVEDHLNAPEGDQYFITTIFPLFDASGRIQKIGGIANNITERKQAEIELKKSEHFLQTLLESIPLPVFYKDVEGRYKGFNKAFENFFGRPKSELINCSVFDINPPELARIYHAKDSELFNKISTQIYESQVKNAYGELRDVIFHKATLTSTSGAITGLVGAIMDITEHKRADEENRRFRIISDNSVYGKATADLQGNLLYVNRFFAKIHGYESEQLIGKHFSIFHSPEQMEAADRLTASMMRDGYFAPTTVWHRHREGTEFPMLMSGILIKDDTGNPQCIAASAIDMSAHHQAEESLRESEEKHRRLFETMAQGVIYQAADGAIISANPAAERILGLSFEQMRGKTSMDPRWRMIKEDSIEVSGKDHPAMTALRTGETVGPVVRGVFHPEKNTYVWLSITAIPLFQLRDKKPFQVYSTFEDITERKQAEQKLQISEKRVRAKLDAVLHPEGDMGNLSLIDIIDTAKIQHLMADLYELTNIGGAIVDLEGNVVASTEWREICARFHRKHPDSLENCIESDTKLTDGIEPGQFREYRCKNNMWDIATPIFIGDKIFGNIFIGQFFYDDEEIDYSAFRSQAHTFGFDEQAYMAALDCVPRFSRNEVKRAMSYYSRLAEILSTLSYSNMKLARTIEEHKRTERERDKLQNQLNQAQKMESVGRLAGGVAHDFNNMLGVILGHTELALLQADENHDLHSDLKEIQKAAKRSADITKQLLAFARKQTISPRQLDLNDTVASMLNMLRRLIGEDIDLVWQPAANLWPVKMDPTQIDQILANLCVNARDAISGVGKLTIETGRHTFDVEYCNEHPGFIPGDFVMLAVSDNGCGMDKNTLDNLFEPFFTTKDVGKGTGLGLATVYGIIKQNNGFINVYSESDQGSSFKIYLPRLGADEDTDKAVPDKKAAAGGTETILLVEDEPSILRMTRMMLERKGYTVISAATPTQAMEKAKNHSGAIDLLMTDVVMPEMNGRDLAEEITALFPGIRLLFMSGYTSNVIAHHGILDEGVAFIQKPFSMADMTEKVRELLDIASDKS